MTTTRHVRRAAYVLLAVGVLAIVSVAFVVIDARIYQASEQRRFERARAAAPVASAAVLEGASLGQILIPRLGLTAAVVEGDSAAILHRAVGHLAETALPGAPGNVVLAAHRDTFFRGLQRIRPGDAITLRTWDGDFGYVVESTTVVAPEAVDVLHPTTGRTLTLVTCFPFGFVGPAPNRFIVRAREVASVRRSRELPLHAHLKYR